MISRRSALVAVLALAAPLAPARTQNLTSAQNPITAPDLAVGQEWSAKGTPAKVIIGRIDATRVEDVVSVSLIDVPTELGPTTFAHAPFAKSALVASLDKLIATGVAPAADFEAGYADWKATHGEVFTISVARAISFATHGAGK